MRNLIATAVLTATLATASLALAQTGGGLPSPIIPPQPIPILCQKFGDLIVCTGGGS